MKKLVVLFIMVAFYAGSNAQVLSSYQKFADKDNTAYYLDPSSKTISLNIAGSTLIPYGESYWIGKSSDAGNRLRLHHNNANAYIDYSPNLYFRSGTTTRVSFLSNGRIGTGHNSSKNTINYELQLLNNSSKIAFGDNNYTGYTNGGVNCFVGEYGSSHDNTLGDTDILHVHGKKGIYFSVGNKGRKEDVKFMIGANGIAYAKEINVTLTGWPDFVFSDNYNLKSLNEVESYIKTNSHLPNVPSAKEVEEGGVNVGEMNKILLQKIEELTLYIIEQNKRIESIEARVDSQE